MKLKLRRSQKSDFTGNVTFKRFLIIDLSPDIAMLMYEFKMNTGVQKLCE